MKKHILAAVSALLLSLFLAVGAAASVPAHALTRGESGSGETDDTGYYILTYIAYGEESMDEEYLSMFGMAGGIILEEEGTGYIYLFDEITDLTWKDNTMVIEDEEVAYTVTDGILEFSIEDMDEVMSLQFTKSDEEAPTREEIIDMFEAGYDGEEDPDFGLEEEPETVIVSTTEELMENIAQNATLILLPGEYNVSEWLEANAAEAWDQETYDSDGYVTAGIYSEEVFDGSQLILNDFDSVTIMSADKSDPARIVCDPRYANVLTFIDCDDLTLDHVVIGHSDAEGYCTGNVLSLIYSWNVNVIDCDLYGCGTYGLYIDDCYNVNVIDSLVHDCTYGCAVITDSTVAMKYTEFYDCQEFVMFEVYESDIDFIGCVFEDLDGEFMNALDDYSEVNLICCSCDDDAMASIESNPSYDAGIYVY